MKKYPIETFIVEISKSHLPVLGQVLHLAKEGGISQAEGIMKHIGNQVKGIYIDNPSVHLVFPNALTAPEGSRVFESCLYMEHLK